MTYVTSQKFMQIKTCQHILAFSAIFSLVLALSGSVLASTQSEIASNSLENEKSINTVGQNSFNPIYKGICDVDPKHPSC